MCQTFPIINNNKQQSTENCYNTQLSKLIFYEVSIKFHRSQIENRHMAGGRLYYTPINFSKVNSYFTVAEVTVVEYICILY
jgi:hypothetical protein